MPPILLDPIDPAYGMRQKADFTREQSDLASESAMDLLSRSMASQREISPTQGIAAALLAAIPTLGGYLIGKSVGGTPKLQAGLGLTYDDLAPTGGNVGGLAGSQIGANASKDYTGAIELDNQHKQKVLAAEAQIESDRAQQLSQQANTVENAALSIDADIAKMPLELQQFARQQEIQAQKQMSVHAANRAYDNANPSEGRAYSPEAIKFARDKLGIDLTNQSPGEVSSITRLAEEQRRAEAQDINLSGNKKIPPSVKTKEKLDSAILVKQIGNRYMSDLQKIAQTNPSYLERNISAVLPATELGKLQMNLGLFAVQLRNAREAGIMTDKDEARYKEYLTIGKLDTVGSVMGRMQELQDITDLTAQAALTSAKAGQENVTLYEELLGFKAPTSLANPDQATSESLEIPKRLPNESVSAYKARTGL